MPNEPPELPVKELLAVFRARFDAIGGQVANLVNERTAIASIIRGLEQLAGEPVNHQHEYKVPEFHSVTTTGHQRVHHSNGMCRFGRDIPARERKAGTGGYPLCASCARLNSGYYADFEHVLDRKLSVDDVASAFVITAIHGALQALLADGGRALTAAEIVAWLAERGRRVPYQTLYKALRREAEKPDGIIGKSGEQFFARPRAERESV